MTDYMSKIYFYFLLIVLLLWMITEMINKYIVNLNDVWDVFIIVAFTAACIAKIILSGWRDVVIVKSCSRRFGSSSGVTLRGCVSPVFYCSLFIIVCILLSHILLNLFEYTDCYIIKFIQFLSKCLMQLHYSRLQVTLRAVVL